MCCNTIILSFFSFFYLWSQQSPPGVWKRSHQCPHQPLLLVLSLSLLDLLHDLKPPPEMYHIPEKFQTRQMQWICSHIDHWYTKFSRWHHFKVNKTLWKWLRICKNEGFKSAYMFHLTSSKQLCISCQTQWITDGLFQHHSSLNPSPTVFCQMRFVHKADKKGR